MSTPSPHERHAVVKNLQRSRLGRGRAAQQQHQQERSRARGERIARAAVDLACITATGRRTLKRAAASSLWLRSEKA